MTRTLLSALAALAVTASGCSGGSPSGSGNAEPTTGPTAGPTIATGTTVATGTTSTVVAIAGLEMFTVTARSHVTGTVAYPQTPPVGGDHAGVWQNCGFYSQPVVTEQAVHSMEHGAVWITFRPGLEPDQVSRLRQAGALTFVLVSPWADSSLPAPVVASAWGRQVRLDSAADTRLEAFVAAFRLGPQNPEPGAPCTGGVGQPS